LPNELLAVERRFGFEGITRVDDMLYVAVQRETILIYPSQALKGRI
ncbi:hypothetical protein SAMN05444287_0001, partial [Octadecabacter temperatus]